MERQERTPSGEAVTELILSTFRANGLLLGAGDLLSADEGLTSARWQVLGAVALQERPLTVPQIARRMGLTRQSVHATVQRLVREGLLELAPTRIIAGPLWSVSRDKASRGTKRSMPGK